MYSIGIDIGGSHITACIFDHVAKKILKESCIYRKVNTKGSKEEILDHWFEAIDTCRNSMNVKIDGVGIAMPGPFDYYEGVSLIKNVDKLSALYKVNVRTILSKKLELPPSKIRFINDATAFSIAETMVGSARKYQRVIAITLGTGLGASFLEFGKPLIQHSMVPEGGFLYNQTYKGKYADDLFSTRGILNIYNQICGENIENVLKICEQIPQNDCAEKTMRLFGERLGAFLKPYIIKFKAEALVIGGNIANAFPFFGSSLKQQLPDITIEISEFGEESAIIGSALLLEDHYFQEIGETIKQM